MSADDSAHGSRPPESVISDIESEYRRIAPRISFRRKGEASAYVDQLEERTDLYVSAVIDQIPEAKRGPLIQLIRKRRSALFLNSGITSEIVGICKQILSFGAAGLALSLGFADRLRYMSTL